LKSLGAMNHPSDDEGLICHQDLLILHDPGLFAELVSGVDSFDNGRAPGPAFAETSTC
jgi:hypothetical protein